MNGLKLAFAYIVSLLILSFAIFGVFHSVFFQFENNEDLALYVRLASIFVIAVSFFLAWYYANVIIRKDVLNKMDDFGFSIINSDFEKISKKGLAKVADDAVSELEKYELSKFEYLGYCLPFLIASVTLIIMGIAKNQDSIFSYAIGLFILVLVAKFSNSISKICSIKANNNGLINVLKNLSVSARGIQFYNSFDFIKTRLQKSHNEALIETEKQISNSVWRSFVYICTAFVLIVFVYAVKKEYFRENMFNIEGIEKIYTTSLFAFFMFLISFFRVNILRKNKFVNISKYQLDSRDEPLKKIKSKNLFIAFHGIYFQDPTKLAERPLINNLSFSILPGEFVAITGENIEARPYIFDLILKFYKPQSGQIYIAGSKIDIISSRDIRNLFGIFEEDFGLINGTIYENLQMVKNDSQKIIWAARKFRIDKILNEQLFDKFGKIQVDQETILRIQAARIAIQNPSVLLIKAPEIFDSDITEEFFYDFVGQYADKKTILLITDRPPSIIYSDKIIYLSKTQSFFGTHAELSKFKEYQKFVDRI